MSLQGLKYHLWIYIPCLNQSENQKDLSSNRISQKWQTIKKIPLFLRSSVHPSISLKSIIGAITGLPNQTLAKYCIYLTPLAAQPQPASDVGESLHMIKLVKGKACVLLYKNS